MNTSDQNQARALCHAAATGDCVTLRQLISDGARVDVFDNAALRRAVAHRQDEAIHVLLAAGATLEDHFGEFLTIAAKNGAASTLKLLLSKLGPVWSGTMKDLLEEAVQHGHAEAASVLLEARADAQADLNELFRKAACRGDIPCMELLLKHGADVRVHNSQPLFDSVASRSVDAVRLVLAAGVDCSVQIGVPLQLALWNGDGEVVELLLEAGVPLTKEEWIVDTAVSDSVECLELLLAHGVQLQRHADAIAGKAAEEGAVRVLQYIVDHATVQGGVLSAGLEAAVIKHSNLAVAILLDSGADPCHQQSAAFCAAIKSSQIPTARSLLRAGAGVRDLPPTALMKVMESGDVLLAKELLRRGLRLDPANVSPFLATRLVTEVAASDLVEDMQCQLHALEVRRDRVEFARQVANKAAQHPCFGTIAPVLWLSQILAASQPLTNLL